MIWTKEKDIWKFVKGENNSRHEIFYGNNTELLKK